MKSFPTPSLDARLVRRIKSLAQGCSLAALGMLAAVVTAAPMGAPMMPSPPAEAALVEPTLPESEVPAATTIFETFAGPDMQVLLMGGPATDTAVEAALAGPRPAQGVRLYSSVNLPNSTRVAYLKSTQAGWRAIVLTKSPDGFPIASIAWLSSTVHFTKTDAKDAQVWYTAISRRLAKAGKASGIALFPNGNALGVSLAFIEGNDSDMILRGRTKFLKAGSYKPETWGPVIKSGGMVSTEGRSSHEGVSVFDELPN